MKVAIVSEGGLLGLRRAMEKEGDELTSPENAELVLSDKDTSIEQGKIVKFYPRFPTLTLEALGFEVREDVVRYTLSRWWDGNTYGIQTLLSIPLIGAMNENLGCRKVVGQVCKFVDGSRMGAWFGKENFFALLKEMKIVGFVTFEFSREGLVGARIGLPELSLYPLLEGWKGKISDLFLHGGEFLESWMVGLLVTRYPWPFEPKAKKVEIGVNPELEKHFWPFDVQEVRKSLFTESTTIGVVTSWNPSLEQACRLVLKPARNLRVEEKQFRTDVGRQAAEVVGELVCQGIL